MKALILAAGYATRLYPLTKKYPKPLLKVGSRPIIEHIIKRLEVIEIIDEIVVITNSKFIAHFRKWAAKFKTPKPISIVDDLTKNLDDRLGAIGDMNFAVTQRKIKDDLLVIGGDNLLSEGLEDFLSFAKANEPHPVIGVYDIKSRLQAKNYGVVLLDKQKKIIDFAEKPKAPKSSLVAMCLYYFPRGKLGLIKEYLSLRQDKQDATGYYIDWLKSKEAVYGFVFKSKWFDIGDYKFYHEAKKYLTKEEPRDVNA